MAYGNDGNNRNRKIYSREDIKGSNKSAIALEYKRSEKAPKVIATGKGYLAGKIIQKAEEENIPVHKDEKLAHDLSKLDIGEYIPPELYQVVAEVLVFVDTMDKIKGKVMDNKKH